MSGFSSRALAFAFFTVLITGLLSWGTSPALAQQEIFVTNPNSNSVTVYRRTATGNIAPKRTLVGGSTGLNLPSGVAVDEVNNELIVVNNGTPSVTVYPRLATGNTVPLRTITGASTGLSGPRGLAVDTVNNELIVVNRVAATVTVYLRTATGNVMPIRTISGPGAELSNPWGVAVDTTNNEILVANNGNSMTVFLRTADGGTVVPLRKLSGANTEFNNGPLGVALDLVNNEVAFTNPFTGASFQPAVLVFARTHEGNQAPTRSIVGLITTTKLSSPNGLAVDAVNNEILVPNSLGNSVTVYGRTQTGEVAPTRNIVGANTLLNNPQFLAVTTSPSATLDLDADGEVQPLTDGLLALRYMFGFQGTTLTNGIVDTVNCDRCDAAAILPYAASLGNMLDIDNDGEVQPLTDGILILRYLFGFRGTTLTSGAVDTGNCNVRCSAATIEPYIGSLD